MPAYSLGVTEKASGPSGPALGQERSLSVSLGPTSAQPGVENMKDAEREAIWDEHIRLRTKLFEEHPLDYLFLEVTRECNRSPGNIVVCGHRQ